MKVLWTESAWQEYREWQEVDAKVAGLIDALLDDIGPNSWRQRVHPTRLREPLQGWCSRRIRGEHRLVYRIRAEGNEQRLEIAQCRYHY